jgi:LAO/AO transport system kinase
LAHNYATVNWEAPVIKTIASKNEGLDMLLNAIQRHGFSNHSNIQKAILLAEKALTLIKNRRTRDIDFEDLVQQISIRMGSQNFNLYQFVSSYTE